ncbi:succinate dehydrogenase/fumarate reductase iron-sulfur subunit [Campylobacter sp. VBCF_05 NA6]|uniref:succinate dehydrogenase/fumarate reductase iron-sulfur subunit n=1 Tax=unclassified Campylobacter TaxID=2593542 RepID=UPI0022EA0DE0|nr:MULTISPECIES: succinate dehydrogenase/fumarate reductase iron-sulfur subunit [unclassified Campylobacter]MDA3056875.1 succinate dehydrogenase/fumarate reductase iron-sulfur subunit [Campylobacter sp. VBCF_04 NA7]MDA3058643.1 succinate dehydrogenase/fumarate reductase iron-sulfur subunit [Campylobacter sp. VBCF_05 NA6]
MKVIIDRFDGTKKYVSTYEVDNEKAKEMTLLMLLQYIKQNLDITLNFTAACRMAICGACGVRVNGHAYLACDTKMTELLEEYDNADEFRISPLANFTVINDLVVDWEPSIDNLRKVRPGINPGSEYNSQKGVEQSQEQINFIKKSWDCILCGCCASECNKLGADASDYMQPFVFVHAFRSAYDSRESKPLDHLKPAITNGLWNCVHCQECMDRCPKGISAWQDISMLRAMSMQKNVMTDVSGPGHAEAFLLDMVEGDGRLNEIKLALRSESIWGNVGKTGIAVDLMMAGKMNPLHVFGGEKIEGHDDLVKMVEAARAAQNKSK